MLHREDDAAVALSAPPHSKQIVAGAGGADRPEAWADGTGDRGQIGTEYRASRVGIAELRWSVRDIAPVHRRAHASGEQQEREETEGVRFDRAVRIFRVLYPAHSRNSNVRLCSQTEPTEKTAGCCPTGGKQRTRGRECDT